MDITKTMIKDIFVRYRNLELENGTNKLTCKELIKYIENSYYEVLDFVNEQEHMRFKNIIITYKIDGSISRSYIPRLTEEEYITKAMEIRASILPILIKWEEYIR